MHINLCDNTHREKCCAKGSGKEAKIQEFFLEIKGLQLTTLLCKQLPRY